MKYYACVVLFILPLSVQAQTQSQKPVAMPCYSENYIPTLDAPVEIAHCVEPEPIKTADHLIFPADKPVVLAPLKDVPTKAHSFSVPFRVARVGSAGAGKADKKITKAENSAIDDHSYLADGKNRETNQAKKTSWSK